MRVSLYELEGKAKKARKHLVLRFPTAKGKAGNWDYFYRATEESILSDDTIDPESLRTITISSATLSCLPLRTSKNKKTYTKINRAYFGALEGNIEGTLISPVEGELPGSLSWALYNTATPSQLTPRSAPKTTNVYRRNAGGVIVETTIGESPQLPPPSVRFATPQTTPTPPNIPSQATHTQRESPLTVDLTPGGHEEQPLTQTPQTTLEPLTGHEEPLTQAPLTVINNTPDTHNTPTTETPNTHNASTDTLENLVFLAEQAGDTESHSILDLIPPTEPPVEALLEPKCTRMGKLLAEVENVVAAKRRHINELADNRPPIVPLARQFQCPSMRRVANKDLLDKLNAAMMSCARECSIALIKAEEGVEQQLRKEISDLSEGWNISHDEYASIKYIKESRLSRIHAYTTRTDPLIFFEITGEGDSLKITPHASGNRANKSGHKIPGKAKGAKATRATKEAPATKVPEANTTNTKGGGKKKRNNKNRIKNKQNNNNKNNRGNKTRTQTNTARANPPRASTNNQAAPTPPAAAVNTDNGPRASTIRQAAPTPPAAAQNQSNAPRAPTNRQAAPTQSAAAQPISNPPVVRLPLPTPATRPLSQGQSKNGQRYLAPHLRHQNPPTRTTGAPPYSPPATFRWTPSGWERVQRDEQTGRFNRWTGSSTPYQPLRYVPSEGQDQNRQGGRNCFRK
ncbi:hypothetical protein GHT06_007676 [Daphnia sinensis]|uniref:Uncharacterized protein n=1 Tax=Daphnia sinensis TaxID=1820382 RepID=A0AAD5Q1C0_9CRUS|nr:hypothetical protein GHT06_007676 [Daphnia sinensis]